MTDNDKNSKMWFLSIEDASSPCNVFCTYISIKYGQEFFFFVPRNRENKEESKFSEGNFIF